MEHDLTPRQKCRLSENNVRDALRALIQQGLITGFRKTRVFSRDDRHGIDFYVFTDAGRMPLQVKSSWAAHAMHHYRYRCNPIPCIVGTLPSHHLVWHLRALIRQYFGDTHGHTAG